MADPANDVVLWRYPAPDGEDGEPPGFEAPRG
jgi:hypothetical protein